MRCSTYHSTLASELPDSKRKFGCWPQVFKQKNFNAISGKNVSGSFCEKAAVIATVMSNRHFYLLSLKTFFQIISITLRSHTNGVFIYPVGTNAHCSAQPTGAKLQVAIKSICQFIRV